MGRADFSGRRVGMAVVIVAMAASAGRAEVRRPFDEDWRFTRGDPADVAPIVWPRPQGMRPPGSRPATTRSATGPTTAAAMTTVAATAPVPATAPTGEPATAPADERVSLSYAALKPYLLATGNRFVDASRRVTPPAANWGGDVSYVRADADDSAWRRLDLPHDWAIEGPFDIAAPGETGKLPFAGVGWYRKRFALPADARGQQVFLDVDGAMSHAAVWCNGRLVGGWAYGYSGWRVDLTPHLKPDGENVLAVRLNNPPESSRWYPGAGLYRHVYLTTAHAVRVEQWGTQVICSDISDAAATVTANVELVNSGDADVAADVVVRLFEADGEGRATGEAIATRELSAVKVAAGGNARVTPMRVTIADPKRWSTKTPNRYVAVAGVRLGGREVDEQRTTFGIRTIAFDARRGFLLNGEVVPLRGVCEHHDLGALGTAVNWRATQRKLEILQAMGCNAIRTSHNPPSPELLELCDRMGMLVVDEAFDAWTMRKVRNGYQMLFDDWHERDWRSQLRRDRNRPCVILWSTGNEVPEQWQPAKFGVSTRLTEIAREEDPTRPTTVATSAMEAGFSGFQNTVDVFGFNYHPQHYARFRAANPDRPLFGSETASTVSSRGEYVFPVSERKGDGKLDFQMSSYDLYAPPWAWPPDVEWRGLDEVPGVAGEFVWTGFDYIGEPTPYNADPTNLLNFADPVQRAQAERELAAFGKVRSPARSSYFGIFDLAGFPKDRYYLYLSRWRADLPMAHLLPHWTWPERVGQVTPVHVYTSGDEAELFLNDRSLGRKKKGRFEYRLRWDDVVYEPGELRVVAYRDGKEWARDAVSTVGEAARLVVAADRTAIAADGQDLSYVSVAVQDSQGRPVPRSDPRITFEVEGPGAVVVTDNGNPTDLEPFAQPTRRAFNGLALAVVRGTRGQPGTLTIRAKADGLTMGEVTVRTLAP